MKKVIYILNLLFLTLLMSGGSVFAAQPTEYIDENGESQSLAEKTVNPITTSTTLESGWYYLDSSSSTMNFTIGTGNPVNIIINGEVTLPADSWITVAENSTVNFYSGVTAGTQEPNGTLSIASNGDGYTIGNSGDFGTINFVSGVYKVAKKPQGNNIAIGSPGGNGKAINISSAAEVTAVVAGAAGTTAVGVLNNANSCEINITGGCLSTVGKGNSVSGFSSDFVRTVNVGSKGSLTISGQGRIQTYSNTNVNVPALVGAETWDVQSGIIGYYTGTSKAVAGQSNWNAIVGGEITVPNFDVPDSDLLNLAVPQIGNYGQTYDGFWNSVTVLPNGNLTLGAEDPDNPDGGFQSADLNISNPQAVFNNNGIVTVNKVSQNTNSLPATWNNNPGSTLNISSGAELTVYTSFNNDAEGQVNVDGTLTISNPKGNQGIQNDGTFNLNGDADLAGTADFDNYGTLDVGPIGTVNGNLTNNTGSTITSQNSSVDLESVNTIKFSPV